MKAQGPGLDQAWLQGGPPSSIYVVVEGLGRIYADVVEKSADFFFYVDVVEKSGVTHVLKARDFFLRRPRRLGAHLRRARKSGIPCWASPPARASTWPGLWERGGSLPVRVRLTSQQRAGKGMEGPCPCVGPRSCSSGWVARLQGSSPTIHKPLQSHGLAVAPGTCCGRRHTSTVTVNRP